MGASYIELWQKLCKRILHLKLTIFLSKTKMPIFNIQDPGFCFAPPWASEIYHAFGVLLRCELLSCLIAEGFLR